MNNKYLLREYYELCEGGLCQDFLTENEKKEVADGKAMYLTGVIQRAKAKNQNNKVFPSKNYVFLRLFQFFMIRFNFHLRYRRGTDERQRRPRETEALDLNRTLGGRAPCSAEPPSFFAVFVFIFGQYFCSSLFFGQKQEPSKHEEGPG